MRKKASGIRDQKSEKRLNSFHEENDSHKEDAGESESRKTSELPVLCVSVVCVLPGCVCLIELKVFE